MIWTIAKKELRGYFNSAVAVIFLGAFLLFAFLMFFGYEKFFARGLADLRPLFKWMPVALIILASALSMRLWADERRAGTLEVMLTLPVPRWKLVMGKFVAGMLLIAIALGLTLGLPLTIGGWMGNLDTGPMYGGYLGALLLSAAYLSIGLCVSAATDNQIVAFVGTALLCGLLYAVGLLVEFFGLESVAELARYLSTRDRFESVARGVLDVRDLAYYGSITVIGVVLNVLLLGIRTWGRGKRARSRRRGAILGTALIGANAIALNIWLAPVGRARLDLTEDKTYSLSSTTKGLVRSLDERLLIRGYFSERTHPLLAPLVPQIRDLLDEYRIAGGDRLRVEVVDPTDSKEHAHEAKERFNIDPRPMQFASQTEQSIVNAYFTIVVEYGDQYEVLRLEDLIQERTYDVGKHEVTLRNLEYQITKTIKKVVASFSSLDTLFASAKGPIRLLAFMTPKTLPDALKEAPDKLKKVADELAKDSGGKLTFSLVEPKLADQPTDPAARQAAEAEARELLQKYGVKGQQLFSGQIAYYHLALEIGGRVETIQPPQDTSEPAFKQAITDALKRGSPGFRKVVGLWVPPNSPPMFLEGMPTPQQRLPPPQTFGELQKRLAEAYEVRPVGLDARVPDDVQVLLLAGPASLDAKAAEHVDQFVMRGGSLIVLAGRHRLSIDFIQRAPQVEKVTTGLEGLFEKWGIKVGEEAVGDEQREAIVSEQPRDLGGGVVAVETVNQPYSLLVKLDADQLPSASVITAGLPGAVMALSSPVAAEAKVGEDERRVDVLLRSSGKSWLTKTPALPNWEKHPEGGVPGPTEGDERKAQTLAVAVTGAFASGVAKPDGKAEAAAAQPRLLEQSPPGTRVVVIGSSTFASDILLRLKLTPELTESNFQLVMNAVDWAVSDTDLLKIRARTPAARAITIKEDARDKWRNGNIIIAALALAAVVVLAWFRRRAVRSYTAEKEI